MYAAAAATTAKLSINETRTTHSNTSMVAAANVSLFAIFARCQCAHNINIFFLIIAFSLPRRFPRADHRRCFYATGCPVDGRRRSVVPETAARQSVCPIFIISIIILLWTSIIVVFILVSTVSSSRTDRVPRARRPPVSAFKNGGFRCQIWFRFRLKPGLRLTVYSRVIPKLVYC